MAPRAGARSPEDPLARPHRIRQVAARAPHVPSLSGSDRGAYAGVSMSKRPTKPGDAVSGDDDLVLERLRRHLQFLGLTRTLTELDERLAWATRERPGTTALLEHVLGAEVAHKLEQR